MDRCLPRERAARGLIPAFPCRHTRDLKIGALVAALSGVIGSVPELIGPVSVYDDWVR